MKDGAWVPLYTKEVIDLEKSLFSGQVFSFRQTDKKEYTGVLGTCLVSFLQDGDRVLYKVLDGDKTQEEVEAEISNFFTLDVELCPLLLRWKLDPSNLLVGLRALRYSLVPTIFSFICSSNNNISRITRMVGFLYSKGEFITRYKGVDFYYFPSVEKLVDIEDELRSNGFGYRSSYICNAARYLLGNRLDYQRTSEIREMMVSIKGIGYKIADCILLIGAGDLSVVPIDTHIFNHSRKVFGINEKRLSRKMYGTIQELYRRRFGEYAGIAQLYIFKGMVDLRRKKPKQRLELLRRSLDSFDDIE
ncbi:8-oxoguanine DNA glycosylase [Encephalitozoon hellem ATCC 50504]|uniref:DNA-(apurinic or apyrimidinic site) lyase n=1 Tax=Encephalitozoon hellem TaxID=27973 RepID=A0A9Q9CBA4_ENCHE|nr:8-oxoguanine DNA glycosylase [Encephalitozoon hellem ATCC 50504]AFM98776.1 8-oxoguanine DNA glycosylase [Encephalitozoon hellem ATCC 50504]UTX43753.1 N-glycosylase/DNA lyase [Encephalitozoon hellem]WEL39231.1 8-oxoguanine DNA glycosylase [Encephalitozoon hellem]|eukprot:XP_003887757.1 8-oxoguanine DNA glycosylase [Encephalitozoon hellem ATCC 50504]